MKIKNTIFVNGAIPALSGLLEEKLPGRVSYKLARLTKEINEKLKVYNQAHDLLVKKYGKESKEKAGEFIVSEKKIADFQKELAELLELEEEYTQAEKIVLPKKVEIAAKTLLLLEDVLEIED